MILCREVNLAVEIGETRRQPGRVGRHNIRQLREYTARAVVAVDLRVVDADSVGSRRKHQCPTRVDRAKRNREILAGKLGRSGAIHRTP